MSEQAKNDWVDDSSFADLNEGGNSAASEMDFPEDSFADMDNLPPIDSLADDDLLSISDSDLATEDVSEDGESVTDAPVAAPQSKPLRGIPVNSLSTLFVFSLLVAGVGLAGALLFALNVDPVGLWAPAGLTQVDQLLNFDDHPLNLVYLVTLGIVLLAALSGGALVRSLKRADERVRSVETLLSRVSDLNLDDDKAWQDPVFKSDPALAAFVTETVGAYKMLDSRLKRQIGFEGELRRLEKAINDEARADLAGKYDHPSIGSVADGVLAYFDAKQQALAEVESVLKKDRHEAESVVGIIQDARGWHRATHDQVGVQGAALERIAGKVSDLAGDLAGAITAQADNGDQQKAVGNLRTGLTHLAQADGGAQQTVVTELNTLVDQGNKLAFQIAMEVARLGARGERLLPMTQSLEELTTNFRQVAAKLQDGSADQDQTKQIVAKLHAQIEQLETYFTAANDSRWQSFLTQANEIGPAAGQVATNLTEISRGFNGQSDRLVKLGQAVSDLASVPFDAAETAAGNPENPPEGSLNITPHDPFGKSAPPESTATEVDPFAGSERLLDSDDEVVRDDSFTSSALPGSEISFGEPADPVLDGPSEPAVNSAEEKTFDLTDVGAEAQETDPAPAGEEVYDLNDLGGKALESDVSPDGEQVFDLTDLGGTPLDSAVSAEEEKVYDLSEFGAVPITDSGAGDDDLSKVHDLTEFGAVSLK